MIGPIVNAIAVVVCSLAGLALSKLLKKIDLSKYQEMITKAIGLSVLFIGIKGALDDERMLILIFSMVLGAVIGQLIDLDKRMNDLGVWVERKLGFGQGNFSKGFVTASILYCTGSMVILGSLESGLSGNHEMLFAKAILDGVISVVFAYELGVGVMFSAIPVFLIEGGIVLAAIFVRGWLTEGIITEMSAVGSLIVAAIGLNFLGVKEIKVANLIPAIFLPWVFIGIEGLIT